jgi:2,3-bisphosphoglycerate-independent phosphoglycerate mutase
MILDGWGLGAQPNADAILQANTPFMDQLMAEHPWSTLVTHGEDVGLPEGQMGNSEVGHLNIGAGRIIWQELARINKAIRDGEMRHNEALLQALRHANAWNKTVHLLGLVSDGGVHAHIDHLKALCDIATSEGNTRIAIHAFTDGRDCDPKSGAAFIDDLERHIRHTSAELVSVTGRYFAMDRDKRWERIRVAYDALVLGGGEQVEDFPGSIRKRYELGQTDEFLQPMRRGNTTIEDGDVVICFNFRTDRLRELTQVLHQADMPELGMQTVPNLHYTTMTRYDESFRGVHVMFDKQDVYMTLGEVLSLANKTQLRIAETEKYPHVTFFLSGGREQPYPGERRILCASPKVATYDLQPEMSAREICDAVMQEIAMQPPDFICLNFANTDMVGHTGVFYAAIKAAETVDECLSKIVPLALKNDYACLIIADHGNADYMVNPDGSPNTAHSTNPVPCILVSKAKHFELRNGRLADVAPTLLGLMGIQQPDVMTGQSLLKEA